MRDSSRISVDWMGVYTGIVSCADCEGIRTRLVLSAEGFYKLSQEYSEKSSKIFENHGFFEWDKEGSNIVLKGVVGGDLWLRVGENRIDFLDSERNLISPLTGNYILQKEPKNIELLPTSIETHYLQLSETTEMNEKLPYLFLEAKEKRFYGFGGCNHLRGVYEITDKMHIRFSKIVSTKMMCEQMKMEESMLEILQKAETYEIKNGIVTLFDHSKKTLGCLKIVSFE